MKKYEINKDGCCVALRSFGDVEEGDIGGFIESEKNLSHEGNCWVSGDARVFGNARVYDDAWVSGNAEVYGNARVYENAIVSENAEVFGNAFVAENTHLSGRAPTSEAIPSDAAKILENLLDSPVESLTMDGITYKKTAAKWERA